MLGGVKSEKPSRIKRLQKKFKRYYGLEFGKDYQIHHIDLNHNNNDINNLMIIPKELHEKYHKALYNVELMSEGNRLEKVFRFDVRPTGNGINYQSFAYDNLAKFMEIMQKMNIWYDYKLYLDGYIPNIHGIALKKGG